MSNLTPDGVEIYTPKPNPRESRTEPDRFDFEASGLSTVDANLQLAASEVRDHVNHLRAVASHFRSETEARYDDVRISGIDKSSAERSFARLIAADEHAAAIREASGPTTALDTFARKQNKRLAGESKPVVASAPEIEAARVLVERTTAKKTKAEAKRAIASEKSSAAIKLVHRAEERVVQPEPVALVPLPAPDTVTFEALDAIRADIETTKRLVATTRRMARTVDEVRAHEHAHVDRRAASIRFDATPAFKGGSGHWEENDGPAHGWSGTFDAQGVLSLLFGDQMKAAIDRAIDEAATQFEQTIDTAARDKALAEAAERLDQLERMEESTIRALEAAGHLVLRRGSASVAAVLSIAN